MFALLLLILWPIAELFVAIKVAEAIGVLAMLLLLIVTWPVGGWVLRSQGRAAWRRLSAAVSAGRSPGREVLDGALIMIGGLTWGAGRINRAQPTDTKTELQPSAQA